MCLCVCSRVLKIHKRVQSSSNSSDNSDIYLYLEKDRQNESETHFPAFLSFFSSEWMGKKAAREEEEGETENRNSRRFLFSIIDLELSDARSRLFFSSHSTATGSSREKKTHADGTAGQRSRRMCVSPHQRARTNARTEEKIKSIPRSYPLDDQRERERENESDRGLTLPVLKLFRIFNGPRIDA